MNPEEEIFNVLFDHGREAAVHLCVKKSEEIVRSSGRPITTELKAFIYRQFKNEIEHICAHLRNSMLPKDLIDLLSADSKKEAIRIAEKKLILNGKQFSDFILYAHIYGYTHYRKHKDFLPPDANQINPENFGQHDPETKLLTKPGKKEFNKISSLLENRRHRSVHVFENDNGWHCFFFDNHDVQGKHWTDPHIHYFSHLWEHDLEIIWQKFDEPIFSASKAHIRYINDYEQ